eukprot:scaffold216522_cov18-Tisochrysis_lutea.AAC.1
MPSEWCACTSILLRLQGFLPAQHAPAHNQPGNGAGAPPVLLFTCCSVFTHLNSVATMVIHFSWFLEIAKTEPCAPFAEDELHHCCMHCVRKSVELACHQPQTSASRTFNPGA